MSDHYPKISIVTPSFNDARYLERTIASVLDQNYPNLEYIIIDGGSSDGSVDIIRKYENKLKYWTSEKDDGMYYAIQKGFKNSTGEIMAWINSDDILHPRGLFSMGQIFGDYPEISWLQGCQNIIDENDRIVFASPVKELDKYFFYQRKHAETYKYIQQESTSWRRGLWNLAGGFVSTDYRYAGDFELWIRFFKYAKLYNTEALIGAFRLSSGGQLSTDFYDNYVNETFQILEKYPLSKTEQRKLIYTGFWEKFVKKIRLFNKSSINAWIERTVINDEIYFDHKSQTFKIRS